MESEFVWSKKNAGRTSQFPGVYTARPQLCDSLVKRILRSFFENPAAPCAWMSTTNREALRALEDFITDPSPLNQQTVTFTVGTEDRCEHVMFLRGLFAHDVLGFILNRRPQENYGVPPASRGTLLAVPYDAADVPSMRSHFAQPDVCIGLTFLAYFHRGLTFDQFHQAVKVLVEMPAALRTREARLWQPLIPHEVSFPADGDVDLNNAAMVTELYPILHDTIPVIGFWVRFCVLEQECKHFPSMLMGSAWDIADVPRAVGFSGTSDAQCLLPESIRFEDHPSDAISGATGQMIRLVTKHTIGTVETIAASVNTAGRSEMVVRHALSHECQVVIDIGGLFAGTDLTTLAKRVCKSLPSNLQGVCFFNGMTWVAMSKATYDIAELKFAHTSADKCLVLFDQARCRGADLRLATTAHALVTLGEDTTKDAFMQAVGRLRKFGRSQTIRIAAQHAVVQRLGNDVTINGVLRWLITNTCVSLSRGLPVFVRAASHFAKKQSQLEGPPVEVPHGSKPSDLYSGGKSRMTIADLENLRDSDRAGRRALDLGAQHYFTTHGSVDQVAEREVMREVQRETEEEVETAVIHPLTEQFNKYLAFSAQRTSVAAMKTMTVCWNGLSPYPFHEARAVQCAMHMAAQLDEHVPDIGYNFGVVTGGVLVGHVGTSSTMRRCVLGLSVFVSQLLPPLGRMINCSILVSEATYSMARSRLTCAPVEVVLYDGQVMILYEAFGSKDEQSVKPRELDLAHKGFAALCSNKFTAARGYYEEMMAGSTSHAPSHADAQFSRLCRVAKYLEDETTRRMEISGLSDDAAHVSYGRNGPSWLIHEVAADHVRLPDDILTALGDHPGNEDDQESSFSSHPLTPLSGTHVGHSGSRRSSVNPIFELRAELEQQLLERTLRASAHSLFRTPQSAFSHADDSINGVPPMWSPESRRNSTSIGEIPAEPSELMEIVDRRGQAWRRSKKCIGKGTFGEVYVGLQSDGSLCAIKIISLPLLMQSAAATAPNRPPGGGKDRLGQSAVESAVSWGEGSLMQQKLAAMTSLGSTNTKDNFDPHADSILGSSMFQFDPGNAPPPTTPLNPSLYSPRPPPSMLSREVDQLLQEVATLSSIKSDNVVRYYGCAVNDGSICIVMEYVGGGSLTSLMGLFGTFPLPSARRFVMDVLRGLRALHEQRIVHRDVGPNNILVTIDGVCKLSDFGCSQSLQKISAVSTRAVAGTPQYMAPEACRGEATTASDIWSLGVLAHVLVTGRLPFADADLVLPPELFIRKMALIRPSSRRPSASKVSLSSGDDSSSGLQSFISGSTHLPMTVCVLEALLPSDALEFVQVCLLRDQTMRPTADQLMMHPFVLK